MLAGGENEDNTSGLKVVMIIKEDNVNEGVVGILLSLSLQSSSLQQKEGGQLLRIMIKDSHHITEMIS